MKRGKCIVFIEDNQLSIFHFKQKGQLSEGSDDLCWLKAVSLPDEIQSKFNHEYYKEDSIIIVLFAFYNIVNRFLASEFVKLFRKHIESTSPFHL